MDDLLVIVLLRHPDTNEPEIVVIGGCTVFARLPASPHWLGIAERMAVWRNAAIRGAWLAQRAIA